MGNQIHINTICVENASDEESHIMLYVLDKKINICVTTRHEGDMSILVNFDVLEELASVLKLFLDDIESDKKIPRSYPIFVFQEEVFDFPNLALMTISNHYNEIGLGVFTYEEGCAQVWMNTVTATCLLISIKSALEQVNG